MTRTVPSQRAGIAARLSKAIEEWPEREGRRRGLRLFQRRMEARAQELREEAGEDVLVGYALSSIQGYMAGEAEPSITFLEEAARVLGVRYAWLAADEGPVTELEAAMLIDAEEHAETTEALILRALARAETKLGPLANHDTFLGRNQVLTGLTVAFLQSGGRSVLSYTPEQVEQAMLTLAWLIYFPADALGATDFWNRPGGREEYFLAASTVLRIVLSGEDSGFPLNAIEGARSIREEWESRLPYRMSEDAFRELSRDRGRGPTDQEDTDGKA